MCRFRGEGVPEDGGVGDVQAFEVGYRNDGRGEGFLSRRKLLFLPSECLGRYTLHSIGIISPVKTAFRFATKR